MSKIKVVQIVDHGEEWPVEYLDDKGRVWYQKYIKEQMNPQFSVPERAHYEWRQLELPEEPES
jgi:hypothetical protein